jgi:hypothetical protein
MSEPSPVPPNPPDVAVAAGAPPMAKSRINARVAKVSALLSHVTILGVVATTAALQLDPAGFDRRTGRLRAAKAPTEVVHVKTRSVTTVPIKSPVGGAEVTTGGAGDLKRPAIMTTAPAVVPSPSSAPHSAPQKAAEAVDPPAGTGPQGVSESASWPEAEVAAAVQSCSDVLRRHAMLAEPAAPIRQGTCGTPAPIKLQAIGRPVVTLQPAVVTNCAVADALGQWVERVLQPAAREIFKSDVVRLVGTGSFVCRNRNGAAVGPISEHAFANAFDVAGAVLADGRQITVLGGWGQVARDAGAKGAAVTTVAAAAKPPLDRSQRSALKGPAVAAAGTPEQTPEQTAGLSAEAKFWRRIHTDACGLFGTVLGPEANDAHRDHLHFDLKNRNGKAYCQ